MKISNTRFGDLEYDPEKTIEFPFGMVGFEHLRRFIVMPKGKEGPLFWIQSAEDPDIAFVLTDPTRFFLDYQVVPDKVERGALGIGSDDECFVLTVVTVPPSREITLNLAAPIFFSPKNNRAIQVILENSPFQVRTPLPS